MPIRVAGERSRGARIETSPKNQTTRDVWWSLQREHRRPERQSSRSPRSRPLGQSSEFLLNHRTTLMPPVASDVELLTWIDIGHGNIPAAGVCLDDPAAGMPRQQLHHGSGFETFW